jgi:hypothetical protein
MGKIRKRLSPKWTQLAISEVSVASPMIISGQVDVFPLQRGEVRKLSRCTKLGTGKNVGVLTEILAVWFAGA